MVYPVVVLLVVIAVVLAIAGTAVGAGIVALIAIGLLVYGLANPAGS